MWPTQSFLAFRISLLSWQYNYYYIKVKFPLNDNHFQADTHFVAGPRLCQLVTLFPDQESSGVVDENRTPQQLLRHRGYTCGLRLQWEFIKH